MEFIMKNRETLARIKVSPQYRQMFREVIRSQIQTLIDQLTYAGEESVLLTACYSENDASDYITVGSELGLKFLSQDDVLCSFREFCLNTTEEKLPPASVTSSSSVGSVNIHGKRKFSEVNGVDNEGSLESDHSTPEPKSSRLLTSCLNMSGRDESSPVESIHSAVHVPKGYSKCSLCNYMSKFKANVTRHERGVHRINLEGVPMVTVQYACAICDYKSTYRSNVMRHEKSVHKLNSTPAELESRKVPLMDIEDDSLGQRISNEGHETLNHFFINQTAMLGENMENQSYVTPNTECNENDGQIKKETEQFSMPAGTNLYQTGNDSDTNGNNSNIEPVAVDISEFDEEEEGCHICNHCQEIFKSLSKLRMHIDNTHFTVGNFMCEKCQKSFNTELSLQIHMSSHSAAKQEVCGCGKAFQYRTSLIRHERKCEVLKTSHGGFNQESLNF